MRSQAVAISPIGRSYNPLPAPENFQLGRSTLTRQSSSRAMSALPPKADISRAHRDVRFVPKADIHPHSITSSAPSRKSREILSSQTFGSLELQVLFDRGVSNGHVNQSSILKPRDELIVFNRIEGDATGAPPEHAIIFGAKSSGGVPVRVNDPFVRGRVADVTVVRGDAIEHYNVKFG